MTSLATATFHDTWAGEVPASLVPFRTTRNGQPVIRYRWTRADGLTTGYASPFKTVAGAVARIRADRRFSNVTEA